MKYNIDKKVIENSTDSATKRFFETLMENGYGSTIGGVVKCLTEVYDIDILKILPEDYFFKA